MGTQLVVLVVVLMSCLVNKATLAQRPQDLNGKAMTKPGCPYKCRGDRNITIPYPFGIGAACALEESFVITCNTSFDPPWPFIRDLGLKVLGISLDGGNVIVENSIINSTSRVFSRANSSQLSDTYDIHIGLGWSMPGNCSLVDEYTQTYRSNSCSPNSQCENYRQRYGAYDEEKRFNCLCNDGYVGNPYFLDGCQDVNECNQPERYSCTGECVNTPGSYICMARHSKLRITIIAIGSGAGTIFSLLSLWRVYKEIKRTNKIKLKKKFFKRNGGLLLQKQLSSGEEGNLEKSKLFTSKDLEKATDRYNKNRILGQGGQGTVYKGMLTDGRIVAIKVSTIVDEGNLEQFINEVVILSQINHRNIVKLHGCCLETEVPLLVYEFIPNGTLFQYIHDKNEECPLSWDARLRIAIEVASALSYLHSAASLPIYHRDIKSTNILLDEKYRAKVADFGTSRSIAIGQTHFTTRVLGTFGYLDPEYFQSSQFSEKSDVYSFGVILLELLTSQKPISSTRSGELQSLTTYFMVALEEKRLFDILDAQVWKEVGKEEITRVANLAKQCLNLSGRKRPTMREVAMELEGIRMPNGPSTIKEQDEDGEYI